MIVERIFISPRKRGLQQERQRVSVLAHEGLAGDRYFGRHDEPGQENVQNITLIEAEEIEAFLDRHGRPRDLSLTRRNIVTRGVRLNDLVGREFFIGPVRVRGIELCEPCRTLGQILMSADLSPASVIKELLHRGGIRVEALTSGEIQVGARISPMLESAAS